MLLRDAIINEITPSSECFQADSPTFTSVPTFGRNMSQKRKSLSTKQKTPTKKILGLCIQALSNVRYSPRKAKARKQHLATKGSCKTLTKKSLASYEFTSFSEACLFKLISFSTMKTRYATIYEEP